MPKDEYGFDPKAADRMPKGCPNCEAADAVCAAYRHALKDIARSEPSEAHRLAMLGLDNDRQWYLGQLFHKIVKQAVIIERIDKSDEPNFGKVLEDLKAAVREIGRHAEATVKGWRGEKK